MYYLVTYVCLLNPLLTVVYRPHRTLAPYFQLTSVNGVPASTVRGVNHMYAGDHLTVCVRCVGALAPECTHGGSALAARVLGT